MKENKNYYIGLDMGTSTVGWAVTDEEYNLIRKKGKDLWGVRTFSEADTAASRRIFRTSKRRLQRQKARIGYLREFFAEEIAKVDGGFYQRMDESKYFVEDKSKAQPYALFSDKTFTDKDYYEKYPTIFHLRKDLILSKEPHDVRLVYLAVLNMFKHRGHFLNVNMDGNISTDIKTIYIALKDNAFDVLGIDFPDEESVSWLEDILLNKELTNSQKHEQLIKYLNVSKKTEKSKVELLKYICGLTGSISTIFPSENYDEETKKLSFSFKDSTLEEKMIKAEEVLEEDQFEIILLLKQIYDWSVLSNIMKDHQYLSFARVESYEKHHKDLEILKKLYKDNDVKKYDKMFRVMEANNYSAYSGSVNSKFETGRRGEKANTEDFGKRIKKDIESFPESEEKNYILSEIGKGTFLPKQLTSSNGVIPNQLHKEELKKILSNAETYLPFLKIVDESGLSVSERIIRLFEFQIPYYIGPIACSGSGKNNSRNLWSVRKENGPVFPWNFEEKIDVKRSSELFIERMVNHCTYINGETVLPKSSLLYERFMVLNELNNLKINGENISVELKQNIYKDLFKKGKKVTGKKVKEYLIIKGICDKDQEIVITGIDTDFTNRLANHANFQAVFGVSELNHEQIEISERIIYLSTVYGDTKKFLKEKIEEEFKDKLTKEQIKRVCGFKFKDWGRLSKELLEMRGTDLITGENCSVIERMWIENSNLMELLESANYTYKQAIEEKAKKIEKTLTEIEYDDLDDLYISAPVRRMTWQTILILKEIYKIMGFEPKKVFIEMARDANAAKERTVSRKKKLLDLYKNCKIDGENWGEKINSHEEAELRSKKLYLYYLQNGKSMYSGKPIDLYELFNDNKYDIDHIYPRHFVKDDSLENNLVLVEKEYNAHKKDVFPIEAEIRNKQFGLWKALKENGFITEEKFKRLTRVSEFTDAEKANFINRQLVETRQGTKVIADLFKQTFKDSEIVYVKAGNVSEFRRKFDLIKCREVNDFHHANDAYLNIVVGNVYNTKFTNDPARFIKDYNRDPKKYKYHMDQVFDHDVVRNGYTAWSVSKDKSITVVKNMMKKNTPSITRKSYEEHGGIADQTIYSAAKAKKAEGKGYIPIKATDEKLSDVCKYGGYTSVTGAYFFLVEHTLKGKIVRTLEPVPVYLKESLQTKEQLKKYSEEKLGYIEPRVCLEKIPMYSLLRVNGFYLYLTGRSGNQLLVCNAVSLVLSYEDSKYINSLVKVYDAKNEDESAYEKKGITKENNLVLFGKLTDKHNNSIFSKRPNPVGSKLFDGKEKFEKLKITEQIYVLLQILQLSKTINRGADLTAIGGVKATGVSLLNKKFSDNKEFVLINQSVTGVYRNEVDLLKI